MDGGGSEEESPADRASSGLEPIEDPGPKDLTEGLEKGLVIGEFSGRIEQASPVSNAAEIASTPVSSLGTLKILRWRAFVPRRAPHMLATKGG